MELRPHHLLCINFFIGEGYSDEFVNNMTTIITLLKSSDPLITFKSDDDPLCKSCINHQNGNCVTKDKVDGYDKKVCELLSINKFESYKYSDINQKVIDKILTKIPLSQICVDCCWKNICYKEQERRYLNEKD